MLLMESLMGDAGESDDLLMIMMMSPGLMGKNPDQANQMSSVLPLLLMDSDSNSTSTDLLMMTMMMNPNADMNTMLPMLMMDDDSGVDMKSLFMMTTMMQSIVATPINR